MRGTSFPPHQFECEENGWSAYKDQPNENYRSQPNNARLCHGWGVANGVIGGTWLTPKVDTADHHQENGSNHSVPKNNTRNLSL